MVACIGPFVVDDSAAMCMHMCRDTSLSLLTKKAKQDKMLEQTQLKVVMTIDTFAGDILAVDM